MNNSPQLPSFKPPSRLRFRRCVFTLNNYTLEEMELIKQLPVQWIVFGREIAPVSGTPHLQGAFVIGKQVSNSTIKSWPGFGRAHFEVMKGTPQQSRDYCSKEDRNFYERGTMPQEGKRNDLKHAVEMVRGAATLKQLAQDDTASVCVVKYHRGLTVLRSLLAPVRSGPPKIFWLHGRTGTGKTRAAVQIAHDKYNHDEAYWISNGGLRWFDGFDGQPVAIFDDFRTNQCPFAYLLRILDRYPVDVEFKGGWVKFNPHIVFITAPYPPDRMFNLRNEGDVEQLTRRLSLVMEFGDIEDYETNYFVLKTHFGMEDLTIDPTPPKHLDFSMSIEQEKEKEKEIISVEHSAETTEEFLE